MTVTVETVADASRITVRPPALPLIAVTPAGLKGVVGPAGFVKVGTQAAQIAAAPLRAKRAAPEADDYLHRAMQESMDLRDQGHA